MLSQYSNVFYFKLFLFFIFLSLPNKGNKDSVFALQEIGEVVLFFFIYNKENHQHLSQLNCIRSRVAETREMSAGCFDNASCLLSPYKTMNDHSLNNPTQKPGILSLLCSDFNNNKIRRTLSAVDMSSQKCLQSNNGFPLKRVQSSLQLQAFEDHNNIDDNDHDDSSKGQAFDEIWSSIQADNKTWGSILTPAKADGSVSDLGQPPLPYVHPLAKRSASSLSEKSLEICTESLGSETGSDGFSYPPSDPEDSDKEHEPEEDVEEQEQEQGQQQELDVSNYKCNNLRGPAMKRSMMVPPARPSFPPPLPSLADRDDGSNLHIRSHRQDGRLVVEAVTVPSQNCFRAQRQDGRLLLTLSSDDNQGLEVEEEEEDQDEMFNDINEDVVKEEDDREQEEDGVQELAHSAVPRQVINLRRSCTTFTMSKLMELTNTRNKSTWPRNYNTAVIKTLNDDEEEVEDEEDQVTVTQPLPHRPRVSTAAVAMNAYEYYWRRNNSPAATAVTMLNPLVGHQNNKICSPLVEKDSKNKLIIAAHNRKGVALSQEEVVIVKAAGSGGGANIGENTDYLFPLMLRGCKESKRSLLFLEPYCIATS